MPLSAIMPTAPARPPLARGLALAAKVLATLAGAGGLIGGVACGVGLAQGTDPSGWPREPAFFGFFVLLASAGLAYVALTLYALGLAADPATQSAPRLVLAAGGALGVLAAVLFAMGFSDNLLILPAWAAYPVFPLLAVALMLGGLALRAVTRRRAR